MRRAAVAVLVAAALAGCDSDDRGDAPKPAPERRSLEEIVIRDWLERLEREDYEGAADLFTHPALIAQGPREYELETREEAVVFNATLPCRADLSGLRPDGRYVLATFDLRLGPLGGCRDGGRDRVRFLIRDGHIREWRRLVEPNPPQGESARLRRAHA